MDFGLIDADGNWCPDCGEPRGVCRCEDNDPPTTDECCPYCGAVWGVDELERERCGSCGWVEGTLYEGDDNEFDSDYDDEHYEDEENYKCGCGFCNCSSDTVVGEVCNACLRGEHQG